MKNLKKLLVFSFFLILSLSLKAQTINFMGGISSTSAASTGDSINNSGLSAVLGYHFGASVDIKINKYLTFQPGITYQTKGSKYNFSVNPTGNFFGPRAAISTNINATFLDIPLNMMAHYDFNKNVSVFATAGPYIGYGLKGNIATRISFLGTVIPVDQEIEWGDDLERIDYGLGFGGGLKYRNFSLAATYDLGLANLVVDGKENNSLQNRIFRISLGYSLDLSIIKKLFWFHLSL